MLFNDWKLVFPFPHLAYLGVMDLRVFVILSINVHLLCDMIPYIYMGVDNSGGTIGLLFKSCILVSQSCLLNFFTKHLVLLFDEHVGCPLICIGELLSEWFTK